MQKIRPALQYSEGRSQLWSGAKLLNCYAQASDGDKADPFMVMAIPGLAPFANVSSFPVRGTHEMGGILFAVIGVELYAILADGTAGAIGTIPGTAPVMMADNGTQLAIQADGDTGYVYDAPTTTLHSSIPNLPPVSNVVYIDGYFVWTVAESDQFIISALGDGLTYDPLDVATVEGDPDDIIGVVNLQRELQFWGAETMEPWWNTGNADFPFERQGNAFVDRGVIDRDSLVKIDNSLILVGNDRIVYRLNGYSPIRISNSAIEFKIASASYFRAFTYTLEGAKQYILNTDVGTWAYDVGTGAWHERQSLGLDNYRVGNATECYGVTILGDAYTGKLYTPSLDVYDEDGAVIPVKLLFPGIQTDRLKAILYSFELYVETGVGNADDPDPQAILRYSKDGGRNWSAELPRSMGAIGEYLTRCIWRIGASFRQLQLEIQLPSSVKRFAISGFADIR